MKTMKNKRRFAIILSILVGTLLSVVALVTVSAYSEDDPIITLSYLNEIALPAFKQEILEEIGDTASSDDAETNEDDIEVPAVSITEEEPENVDGTVSETDNINVSYTLLELERGQTVLADSICEFISRPGSFISVVSPFETQGIADITNGNELYDGMEVPVNAYCLIPRGGDGRGFTVTSQKAFIMIRGEYTIG